MLIFFSANLSLDACSIVVGRLLKKETDMISSSLSHFSAETSTSQLKRLAVTTHADAVQKLFQHIALHQSTLITPKGLKDPQAIVSYVQDRFKDSFLEHAKELLFKLHVHSTLYRNIQSHKIITSGTPRLAQIDFLPSQEIKFSFDVTSPMQTELDEWKYLVFKFPQRKFYKDLDKQAEIFIKQETENESNYLKLGQPTAAVNDWVCFDLWIADQDQKPLLPDLKGNFWLKIGSGEIYLPFQELFIGKSIGAEFFTDSLCLQEFFSEHMDTKYCFGIKIIDILPQAFFSISQLQDYFKIKTKKKTHQKLIEVFSYRNDLSLRRAIVEDLLAMLLRKQYLTVPRSQVLRHQQYLLNELQDNADYPVYKIQKNFQSYIEQLAEKQVKEMLLIDQIGYQENLACTHQDIAMYLNLTSRPRTKEFIYFQHPTLKANAFEYPISADELSQTCLREKTLNYIINHLENY